MAMAKQRVEGVFTFISISVNSQIISFLVPLEKYVISSLSAAVYSRSINSYHFTDQPVQFSQALRHGDAQAAELKYCYSLGTNSAF